MLRARGRFDEAQSAVVVHGAAEARVAAEGLREAWAPRLSEGPAPGWRERVEAARSHLLAAITAS